MTNSTTAIQLQHVHFEFPSSDAIGLRTDTKTVNFRNDVSHAIAVVQGYDGTYTTGSYQQIARAHFKVDAKVDDDDRQSVDVTCEWEFGPEVRGYPSKGDVWVTVLAFTT